MAGSPSYDFLAESFLFDDAMAAESFGGVSDGKLQQELERYREFIDSTSNAVRADSEARILAGTGAPDLRLLAQCAWYVSEFIVRDPLYELTSPKTNAQAPLAQLLGLKKESSGERRKDIRDALALMRSLTPMVAAGYVTVLPISRAFEPPSELPITAPTDGGANLLPPRLMEWFKERALIWPVEIRDGQMLLLQQDARNAPRRSIGVEFRVEPIEPASEWTDDSPGGPFLYNLLEQRIVSFDEHTKIAKFVAHLPDEAPSEHAYRAWVRQSIHQSAAAFADRTIREVRLADALGARFLTRSRLAAEFLSLAAPTATSNNVVETTLNAVLNLDVPFLEGIAIEDLMRIRQDDGEAFQAFRGALEKELRALELESDSEVAKTKAEHVRHELVSVQLVAIETQIKKFKIKLLADAVLAVGSLLASVPTAGISLVATGIAAASVVKAKAEYDASVKQHPAYFLWRVRKARHN